MKNARVFAIAILLLMAPMTMSAQCLLTYQTESIDAFFVGQPANFQFEGPHANQVEIFLSLYFAMTGLHAVHMVIGFGLLAVIAWMAWKRRFSPAWFTPVEMAGLYWHFVDIVWIFLFPLLYLVDRAHHFA